MNDLEDQLTGAFERLAEQAPHHPDLAGTTRRRGRRRRMNTVAAVAAASLAAVVTGLLAAPNSPFHGSRHDSDIAVAPSPPCRSAVTHGVLPEWARGGFSDPRPVMPFVTSASGNVVGILFGDPLSSPPRPDIANKVLWVWHDLPADTTTLHASARLNGTGPVVTTGLPSPLGPSYVDLPAPGCWRLSLTWAGGSDTIDLQALTPADAAGQS
jgi:hypothetical protein